MRGWLSTCSTPSLQVLLDLRPERLLGRLLALLVDHRDVALEIDLADLVGFDLARLVVALGPVHGLRPYALVEVDELLARHLRRLDLALPARKAIADLVPQRLLRVLLARDDEHR